MTFPLSFWDLSLLFAVIASVLLITFEILSASHNKVSMFVSKKRMRNAAAVFSICFLIAFALRVLSIVAASG